MIEPTKVYQNLPAMQPEQVAQLICKAMIQRRCTYAPWWLMVGQLGSVLFRGVWEAIAIHHLRRK